MVEKLTVIDRLEIYADAGETSAPLKLWKPQISRLENEGFFVEKIAETERIGEFYCNISWAKPSRPEGVANELLKMSINSLSKNITAQEGVAPPYCVRI